MRQVTVFGAGFSGLATAYFLHKEGLSVRVMEKSARPGGLINTIQTPYGLVETAANGLMNSARLEAMCADIGVTMQPTRSDGRRRFILRGRPRQLPLNVNDILSTALHVTGHLHNLRPLQFETIADWGRRVLGAGATNYLLVPALGGIYAGDPEQLSATLIFGKALLPDHLGTSRPEKAKVRGTVAPAKGMRQLIDGLHDYLKTKDVEFIFNCQLDFGSHEPVVVCLSASSAAELLSQVTPAVGAALQKIEMLSLVTATAFYGLEAEHLKGFGCLFPPDQGFRARGVLFNNSIFEGRGPAHSETWIFGGARDPEIVNLNDEELTVLIAAERRKFYSKQDKALAVQITRWPRVLPHYSVELERTLSNLPAPPENIALVGNYLGRIGLAKILERAAFVARDFGSRLR